MQLKIKASSSPRLHVHEAIIDLEDIVERTDSGDVTFSFNSEDFKQLLIDNLTFDIDYNARVSYIVEENTNAA